MGEYKNDTGLCSVTTCFSPYISWDKISPQVLANAAERGSRVHQALADELNGEFAVVDDEIRGYVEAGRKFMENVEEVLVVEERLISDVHQYTGQVDLVCRMSGDEDSGSNSRLTIVDFKTSSIVSKSWPLQLAGYAFLVKANNIRMNIKRHLAVQLRKDGTYKINEYTNPARDFSLFLNALTIFKYFNPKPIVIDWESL